jgi:double-stranded uracil-DNA glycosylase
MAFIGASAPSQPPSRIRWKLHAGARFNGVYAIVWRCGSEPVKLTRAELTAFHGDVVDDLVDDRVRLLFVGINPGLWTAAVNAHFARRGNRFWPALYAAGITPRLLDLSDGMSEGDRDLVLGLGIGITNIVPTASARAEELGKDELRAGAAALEANVQRWKPSVVAVLGLTAYRQAFATPKAVTGRQDERLGGAELWVLPNPSGLNAHETIDSLAASYRQAWVAAAK